MEGYCILFYDLVMLLDNTHMEFASGIETSYLGFDLFVFIS